MTASPHRYWRWPLAVNGLVRATVSDATLTAGGIGVILSNGTAEFDNVVVTE